MISFARATGNEIEVLRAALEHYELGIVKALVEDAPDSVRDDATWRRHIVAELLGQIADR